MGCQKISIHCYPHIRRYLLVRLSPGERLSDAHELLDRLSEALGIRISHAPLDDQLSERPRSRLELVVFTKQPVSISTERAKRFGAVADRSYNSHSHHWMDWYRATMHVPVRDAIRVWRSRYSISEGDQALLTAEKAYYRYRQRNAEPMRRGGPRYGPRYRQR